MVLDDVVARAGLPDSALLAALPAWCAVQGAQTLDASHVDAYRGLHPLVVPFARGPDGRRLGLLRWVTPPDGMPAPVVREGAHGLHLVASSLDVLVHHTLANLDAQGRLDDDHPLLRHAPGVYARGAVHEVERGLPVYLLLHVGPPPSFFEELVAAHLARGDVRAALVTADRAVRSAPGWARPLAHRADVLHQVGRAEEARDAARVALLEPIWTLGAAFGPVAELAGLRPPWNGAAFRALADDVARPVLDRAAHLLDAVAADGGSWDDARTPLATLYAEAGLEDLATFVREPAP